MACEEPDCFLESEETAQTRMKGKQMKPNQTLGDKPIEPAYRKQMETIAHILNQIFNRNVKDAARKTGFVLMVFPFGDAVSGRCNYISNGADRKDVVALMKEMIARFEGQPDITGKG